MRVVVVVTISMRETVEFKHLPPAITGRNRYRVWCVDADRVRHAQGIGPRVSVRVREIRRMQSLKESLTQEVLVE